MPEQLVIVTAAPIDGAIPEGGLPALANPQFIVRDGDNYYLTVALWAYNKVEADALLPADDLETIEKQNGANAIIANYELNARNGATRHAVKTTLFDGRSFADAQATDCPTHPDQH